MGERIELRLDIEIVDYEYGKPSLLHLSHPKLDGVLEFYLDSSESMEDQLSGIEIGSYREPPKVIITEPPRGYDAPRKFGTPNSTGSIEGKAVEFVDRLNILRKSLANRKIK